MWQRRTFHECASELSAISDDFRAAYTNRWDWPSAKRERVMLSASERGVEVLRILAQGDDKGDRFIFASSRN